MVIPGLHKTNIEAAAFFGLFDNERKEPDYFLLTQTGFFQGSAKIKGSPIPGQSFAWTLKIPSALLDWMSESSQIWRILLSWKRYRNRIRASSDLNSSPLIWRQTDWPLEKKKQSLIKVALLKMLDNEKIAYNLIWQQTKKNHESREKKIEPQKALDIRERFVIILINRKTTTEKQ